MIFRRFPEFGAKGSHKRSWNQISQQQRPRLPPTATVSHTTRYTKQALTTALACTDIEALLDDASGPSASSGEAVSTPQKKKLSLKRKSKAETSDTDADNANNTGESASKRSVARVRGKRGVDNLLAASHRSRARLRPRKRCCYVWPSRPRSERHLYLCHHPRRRHQVCKLELPSKPALTLWTGEPKTIPEETPMQIDEPVHVEEPAAVAPPESSTVDEHIAKPCVLS